MLSIVSLVSNAVAFRGYVLQQNVVADMNNIIPQLSLEDAKYYELKYPNINIFTVPFKTHLGRAYLRDSLYDLAIETFHEARKINPYLLVNENYLAELYFTIGKKDSFKYYANKIFDLNPNHPGHFGFYIKSIDSLKNSIKIDSAFNLIYNKTSSIWKIYLAALYNSDSLTSESKTNIKIADSIFQKDTELQYLLDNIKYGQENIKKANELIRVSDKMFQDNLMEDAIITLETALNLYPNNNEILDKISTIFYKKSQHDSSLKYLNMIDLNKYENLGRYHLIKGINLFKLGDSKAGCEEIYKSILLGDKEAIKANKSFCN